MATVVEPQLEKPRSSSRERGYSLLTPRFWHGMLASDWWKLLAKNRFSISPTRVPMAFAISLFSAGNSVTRVLQEAIYGRRADAVEITKAPIFIIGHWRSGTTLLHELMVLDKRHTYPTTYECFAPNHFLLTESLVSRWFNFVLPTKRPMDGMPTGWLRPQEDEFALCNLGIPSPYLSMAFPNHAPVHEDYLDLEKVSEEERQAWKEAFLWFLKRRSMDDDRRIVLKSPPHTGRIKTLLEMFPDARFIHIVRDPFDVYGSTVKLWKALHEVQSLHIDRQQLIEEYVFNCFEIMYRAFLRDRYLIPSNRFYELHFEDLIADPSKQISRIYDHLDLAGLDEVLPKLENYRQGVMDSPPKHYELPLETRLAVSERWGEYARRYGYDVQP